MSSNPSGMGVWIAFASVFGGHERAPEKLEACGASWVAPRGGQGKFRDLQWKSRDGAAHVKRYHDAGIKVYPWVYDYPKAIPDQIALYRSLMDDGADGVIIDAEEPWERIADAEKIAEEYVCKLYDALGCDTYIADAPWPYCLWHPKFPHEGFALGGVKARHIQLYWTEISNAGERQHVDSSSLHWRKFHSANPEAIAPVHPIGITYGRDLRGVVSKPPGELRGTDLENFVRNMKEKEAFSLYSLEQVDAREAALIKAALRLPPNRPLTSFGD